MIHILYSLNGINVILDKKKPIIHLHSFGIQLLLLLLFNIFEIPFIFCFWPLIIIRHFISVVNKSRILYDDDDDKYWTSISSLNLFVSNEAVQNLWLVHIHIFGIRRQTNMLEFFVVVVDEYKKARKKCFLFSGWSCWWWQESNHLIKLN